MSVTAAVSIARMPDSVSTATRDGIAWGIGNDKDVAWVKENTVSQGRTITVAIPAVFADYATLLHPGEPDLPRDVEEEARQDRALLAVLQRHTAPQPWWLGYLDTGASDIVFWEAPKTTLYWGWNYVLVRAGPQQAASWRPSNGQYNWKSTELPELMFPADHSWLVSTLWDDDWTCVGGPVTLIADLLRDPQLARRTRRVTTDQDPTPPEVANA
jgi:hypothetical protein